MFSVFETDNVHLRITACVPGICTIYCTYGLNAQWNLRTFSTSLKCCPPPSLQCLSIGVPTLPRGRVHFAGGSEGRKVETSENGIVHGKIYTEYYNGNEISNMHSFE
jgi:hypothetical protein